MTSLKTSIKTITYLSDIGCLEIQGASLQDPGHLKIGVSVRHIFKPISYLEIQLLSGVSGGYIRSGFPVDLAIGFGPGLRPMIVIL
ncbi:hypothetical protein D9Z23_23385 [Escherichia coli]|nr:hypothetical protein [Escherichia coli]